MNAIDNDAMAATLDHYELFRRAAAVFTSSLELEQALANTISVCLPYIGDFGFFDVILDDGVRRTAHAHQNPTLQRFLQGTEWQRNERTDLNLCALSSGEPVLHEDTNDEWYANAFNTSRTLAFSSMLSVPLRFAGELVGSLTLFMGGSGRRHNTEHLELAFEMAALAAPVVVNARLLDRERRIQLALKHSEERLRLATEAGRIGIWEWDIPNNRVTWSKLVYELHGLMPGEFGGTVEDFAALVHPDDRPNALKKITGALVNAETLTDQFRVIRPDHSVRWLTTSSYIERDANGNAVRMLGSTADITEQKSLQFGLEDLNRQLSERVTASINDRDRIWRLSLDILAVASFSGYLVSVNPAFTKTLGWGESELLSIPFIELCHRDQREEAVQVLLQLKSGKQIENFEVQTLHKNGGYRWLSWTSVADGDLVYAVGRDITEARRQREYMQLATEKRFQLALSAAGMGAWQWDLISGAVHWWPGMDKIHGLPAGSDITQAADYIQFVHPEDKGSLNISQADLLVPKTFTDVEYRIVWPDGSVRWIESRREQILNQDGKPILLAGVCIDITDRKLMEQNLRFLAEASAEFSEVVDHEKTLVKIAQLAVPTFADWCTVDLLDNDGKLKRVSVSHVDPEKIKLAHELHDKYPPDPQAPRGAWQILATGQAELVSEIDDEMLRESIKDPVYLDIIRQLGLRSYIGVPLSIRGKTLGVLTFISAESRRIYGPKEVSLATDIGRRAAIAIENSNFYRSLKEADRRKDDFLAMLAHELRNPLAPIKAAADLLNRSQPVEGIKETSEIITRQVNHMAGLVDDLLDVSRVNRGLIRIDKKPVLLKKVVTTALEQTKPQIDAKQHQLDVNFEDEYLYIEGDEERLVQIISNLLTNATKFTPTRGNISVTVRQENDRVTVYVRDNGIGMTADLLSTAFDLFVQGNRASDRGLGGLGLGLALVKTLVSLHDGTVVANSDGEGLGSEFILRFPALCYNGDFHPVIDRPYVAPIHTSVNVLIVDDNKDAADTLMMYLQAIGHNVEVVYDPKTALRQITEKKFDKIILDIGLPDIDGYELARQIRAELGASTPTLIAVSGYGQLNDRNAAFAAGINHYLVKPVDVHKLLALINLDVEEHRNST